MGRKKLLGKEEFEGWIFILPILLGVVVFSFVPVIYSLVVSFTNWDGINPPKFTGFENYIRLLFEDEYFHKAVFNTFVFTFVSVPLGMAGGLFLAMLANQPVPFKNAFRTAYFAPSITSTVAIALVWGLIFSPNTGLLNSTLNMLGINGPDWLGTSKWAMPAVILVEVWFVSGYNMVIYLAGLQGISESLYESARLDGANRWRQFIHITLPMLSPTSFFLMITSVISSFQVFNLIYVLTQGGPAYATTVYIHYLYLNAFNYFKMGFASSMAWLLFIVLAGITFVQMKMQKRWVHYE
ncbi:MAG: sugar ABC transporter permease [Treponema sp.]|jgi:multiple sugar transport system permease protein|nr:sugar ABC transporter permease [Treponema sp.]